MSEFQKSVQGTVDLTIPGQRVAEPVAVDLVPVLDAMGHEVVERLGRSGGRRRHAIGHADGPHDRLGWALAVLCSRLDKDDLIAISPQARAAADAVNYLIDIAPNSQLAMLPVDQGDAVEQILAAAVRRYIDVHFGKGAPSRFVAVMAAEELDNPYLWEVLADRRLNDLAEVLLVVDSTRADADAQIPMEQWRSRFDVAGWHQQDLRDDDVRSIAAACAAADAREDRPSVVFLHHGDPTAWPEPAAVRASRPHPPRSESTVALREGRSYLPVQLPVDSSTDFPAVTSTDASFGTVLESLAADPDVGYHLVTPDAVIGAGSSTAVAYEALAQLGLSWRTSGHGLLPVGSVGDPAGDTDQAALSAAALAGARFLAVGSAPAGVAGAPGTIAGVIRLEPAFVQALDWLLCDALTEMASPGVAGHRAFVARVDDRQVAQEHFQRLRSERGDRLLRQQVLAGAYRIHETAQPALQLCGPGTLIPELLLVGATLEQEGVATNVVEFTSADRVYDTWQTGVRFARRTGSPATMPGVLSECFETGVPVLAATDAASAPLEWLGCALSEDTTVVAADDLLTTARRLLGRA